MLRETGRQADKSRQAGRQAGRRPAVGHGEEERDAGRDEAAEACHQRPPRLQHHLLTHTLALPLEEYMTQLATAPQLQAQARLALGAS